MSRRSSSSLGVKCVAIFIYRLTGGLPVTPNSLCEPEKFQKLLPVTEKMIRRPRFDRLAGIVEKEDSGKQSPSENLPASTLQPPLLEGRDYYMERGFVVFTAEFLKARGSCCHSGCRHCPYKEEEN
jgi:hypothetical protein